MIPHSGEHDPVPFSWPQESLSPEDTESILEEYSHKEGKRLYILRDFFSEHFPEYCSSHKVPEEKLKTMNSLIACKTGKLGHTLIYCPNCKRIEMRACACGNHNCPSCGYLNEKRWVALRQSEVIPDIPYFHLIFTLPHELNPLMYQNQKETLNLLFRSVKDTILILSKDKLKMTPGILMVLHSFGSNLSLHYHLHVLVSGGGLTADKKDFKRCLSGKFFLPAKAVQRLYRGRFLDGLKKLRSDRKLCYYHDAQKLRNHYAWKELLNACYGTDWNVEIKKLSAVSSSADADTENTDNAISYFARYTNRTAISDARIRSYDNTTIQFNYKVYKGSGFTWKAMTLQADEFIRRFLMHILPNGFIRVRSAGFLAGCVRKKNLELIHHLLGRVYRESPVKKMKALELIRYFYDCDLSVCKACHESLDIYPRVSLLFAARFIRAA